MGSGDASLCLPLILAIKARMPKRTISTFFEATEGSCSRLVSSRLASLFTTFQHSSCQLTDVPIRFRSSLV
jgi:hypothetical protein